MTTEADIIAALPALQSDARKRVRLAMDLLDSGRSDSTSNPDDAAVMLWDQLVSVAQERGMSLPPSACVQRVRAFKQFRVDAEHALTFIKATVNPTDKTELRQAVRLGARALLTRLKKLQNRVDLTITPQVVMRHVTDLPAAMQNEWPGGPRQLRFLIQGSLA